MQYPSSPAPNLTPAEYPSRSTALPSPTPTNNVAVQPAEEEAKSGNKIAEITELLRRRSLLIVGVASIIIANAAWKLSQQPTVYYGNFQMLVEPVNTEFAELTVPSNLGNSGNRKTVLDYPSQFAILRSPALLEPAVKELQKKFPDINLDNLFASLKIRRLGETKIIEVSFESNNQARTLAVLETLSENYLEYSVNRRQTYLKQGIQFVDGQLKILQAQVDSLQDQLQNFRQTNNFFKPEERSSQLAAQLTGLEDNRSAIQQELLKLKFNLQAIQTEQGIRSIVSEDAGYQELLAQIRQLDTQINLERTRFQDNNIVIQSLKQQRDNLVPLLENQGQLALQSRVAQESVKVEQLEAQLKSIDIERNRVTTEIKRLPLLTRDYENLERKLGIAVNSLTGFLETRQSLQIQSAQSEIPWELVNEPSSGAVPSDFTKALINKILLGLAVGVGIAFALDKIDGRFHTVDALKRKINVPLLGILPFNQQVFLSQESMARVQKKKKKLFNRLKQLIIQLSNRFSDSANKLAIALFEEYDGTVEFFESLRLIHTNIQQLMEENQAKTFVITSASVGEGKTTLAINLADTAAVMGQKVLLVDGNFRKPEIHEFLNLKNEQGLSDLIGHAQIDLIKSLEINLTTPPFVNKELAGQEALIQKVFNDKEFYVLSAGPIQAEASILLNVNQLSTIIEKLRNHFDLIIFDVPSILGVADATIFSRCTDALIIVASLHKTSQFLLENALNDLEEKNIPVLGIIANQQKGADPVLRATLSQSNYSTAPSATPMTTSDFEFTHESIPVASTEIEQEERITQS